MQNSKPFIAKVRLSNGNDIEHTVVHFEVSEGSSGVLMLWEKKSEAQEDWEHQPVIFYNQSAWITVTRKEIT